jgi:glycosyltransferase involved in cell wall biosynthesis
MEAEEDTLINKASFSYDQWQCLDTRNKTPILKNSLERIRPVQILVVIAALNEEQGIGPTIDELKQTLDDPRILIVDGKSVDNTVGIAEELGAEIVVQKGSGKGDAIAEAMKQILTNVDYVVLTDADHTYPAGSIRPMIQVLETQKQVGMVCGNRFTSHINLGRQHSLLYIGNRLICFLHNLLNGVQLNDPLTGLRVVRSEIMRGWRPESIGFDIEVELNHWVERNGYTIAEVPINYRRRLGVKKLKIRHGLTIMRRILIEALR